MEPPGSRAEIGNQRPPGKGIAPSQQPIGQRNGQIPGQPTSGLTYL